MTTSDSVTVRRKRILPENSSSHMQYMRRCIELARRALVSDDAPVGALVVLNDRILGEGVEGVKARHDVTAHAEIQALRAASDALGSTDLAGSTLYTSVEPCVMCAYAIRLARVSLVVTGARSPHADASLNGWAVLASLDALPDRPIPVTIRDVMAKECHSALTELKETD
jgi:tRNA(adenine34) deaminase